MTDMSTAVARQDSKAAGQPQTVARFISGLAPQLQRALPKHLDGDRMLRIATTLIRASEMAKGKGITQISLSDCTPESFAGSLLSAAALGLEPGVNGEAWLIPYNDRQARIVECTLQIGYQGMLKLAWQSPIMQDIGTGFVCANDDFDYDQGMDSFLRHKAARGDRGDVTDYYAWAKLTTGGRAVEVMDPEAVKALRGKVGPNGKIKDPQRWMERKTVLKQLLKPLPKSAAVAWAHRVDEQTGGQMYAQQVPTQIAEQVEAPADRPALEGPTEEPGQYANAEQAALQPDPWAQ